ncbi:MAG: hypothetical protein GX089_12845 [Fibrobacter sp.]|jgi:hypothetical protein|nr:hypothetical protein [Fibrobacter sp.]
MFTRKTVVLSAFAVAVLLCTGGEASMVGGRSGAYLRPPVGATSLAMGGTGSAAPEDLLSWWNPSQLSFLRSRKLAAGIGMASFGRSDAFGAFEFRIPPRMGMGFLLLYRGDPFLKLYDEQEQPLEHAAYTTLTGKIALSYYVNRNFTAGASIGIHYQSLPTIARGGDLRYSSAVGIGAVDLSFTYKITPGWTLGVVAKDLGAGMDWEIESDYYNNLVQDRPLPSIAIGSKYKAELMKKPLIWAVDLKGYFFDGNWKKLYRPEGIVNLGWEWQYWERFFIRAGISEFLLNGDLLNDRKAYFANSPVSITMGFSLDLSRYREGLKLNYAIATDKLWAGVGQQVDITMSF